MTIENNKVVSVNYLLTKKNTGEQVEQTSVEHPFVFIFGTGGLLEDFETNLINKKAGDTFDFFIDHARGYGVRDEQYLVNIPIDAFLSEDGKFDETIKYSNGISGNNQECYNKYYYTFIFAPHQKILQQKDRKHKVLYDTADDAPTASSQ